MRQKVTFMDKNKYLSLIIPLLKEEGLGLSMDAVAQKIGVTKKTLYNQFVSKDQMIEECLKMVSAQFRASLSCMDGESVPVEKRFADGVTTLRLYFREMSRVFMRDLMEYYPQKASLDHTAGSAYFEEKISENIEEGKRRGVYRPDIDSSLFAKYIAFSIFSFFQKEVMMRNTYSADHYFEQVIKFNINALLIKQQ